ncbi:MAG: DNA-3-methyladenine glycosylase 2 family protein [Burkholderiales bacterium]|nr:MAG: DNA-3-methyladenine glycosylase 2 family protein [Burkholderiales bacterium]
MLPQTVDAAACWRMLRARDARFDGRFFVGVTSTGIYCRPVCTARTPRRENCRFFPTAAGAEHQGFRPCLRCRPELAPGHASVDAPARLAQAAAAAIEEGALEDGGLPGLARRLGVTDRHLRRVFDAQFGVSPIDWAQTHRLLLAKRLLTDTTLAVTEVALASGFASLRRFNDAFATRYRLAPTDLRKQARGAGAAQADPAAGLVFRLAYRPPLDWGALTGFLALRTIDGVETVETAPAAPRRRGSRPEPVYRRIVRVPAPRGAERLGWIEVARPAGRGAAGHLLEVRVDAALLGAIPAVLARVRRVFDLACRPDEVADVLGDLARGHEGVRLPGAFDGFEIVVRAILGQQITVKHARTLAGRFAAAFGEPVATPWPTLRHAFPSAASIAGRDPAEIGLLGITRQRSRTIVELARALADGGLRLEPDGDAAATIARLVAVPGIGDWTAQYLAMRALGWPDAFPASDVGVMRALGVKTPREALAAAEAWRPWRGYAVIHLWRTLAPVTNETTIP